MFTKSQVWAGVWLLVCSGAGAAEPATRLVRVTGHGDVMAAPDRVSIQLTITTTDDDLIRVRAGSDTEARTVLDLAKKHGIEEGGFEVSRLELSLDFNEQLRRQIYQVERDISVSLSNLSNLDALLSDLLAERSLKVGGIQFLTSQTKRHEAEARRQAVADAKEKAQQLAELNGLTLGKTREIYIVGEFQRPFTTSVIPVVGAGAQRSWRRSFFPADDPFGGSSQAAPSERQRIEFVAFQPPKEDANEKERKDARGKPFALGAIQITADVAIEFELVE